MSVFVAGIPTSSVTSFQGDPHLVTHDPDTVQQPVEAGPVIRIQQAVILELSHHAADMELGDQNVFVLAQVHLASSLQQGRRWIGGNTGQVFSVVRAREIIAASIPATTVALLILSLGE